MKKILCAGILVADILAKPVERFDYSQDTWFVDSIQMKNGGDAMNNAIILAKLGAEVCFAGRVGSDALGDFLRGTLESAGIETYLATDDSIPTSSCIVLISSAGERSFLYSAGANAAFCSTDISDSLLKKTGHIHIGGALSLRALDGCDMAELFKRAKSCGNTVSMDVTADSTGRWYETLRPVLPYVDYFLPSISEAEMIAGTGEPDEIADFLLEKGVGTVVIKLGEKGCLVKNKRERIMSPAYKGLKVVDTTGAGDAFCAGFIYALTNGFDLERCAAVGNAVGGLNTTKIGATGGAADWHTVQDFMENNPR